MRADVIHFSRLAMISVHYGHCWSLPSLCCGCLEKKASDRRRLSSAPLLPFSRLAWAPACLCEKAAIKQTQQAKFRSQEFHSLPNEKGCWAAVSACRKCGERSRHLLGGAGTGGKQTYYLLYPPRPKPRPQRLDYVRFGDCPTEKSWQGSRSRISFSFSVCTAVSRQACHICTLHPGRKRYIVYSFQEQHCGEPTTLGVWSLLLWDKSRYFCTEVFPQILSL